MHVLFFLAAFGALVGAFVALRKKPIVNDATPPKDIQNEASPPPAIVVPVAQANESPTAAPMPEAQAVQNGFLALYQEIGAARGVDPDLLRAIVIVESSENPLAENPNDPSVGLGQVLCKFDKSDPDRYCRNRLNVEGWDGITWNALKDPRKNLDIAAQILEWNIRTYGFPRGVAVYNRWESRHEPISGPFTNQSYVNKVLSNLRKLKGT